MWYFRTALLFALLPLIARAQSISVGVTGGIPISPHSNDNGNGCAIPALCGPNRLSARPYAVGPTVAVHLPWRISVEAGMLYERFHQDAAHGLVAGHGGPISFGQYFSVSANGWLFPLQVEYDFKRRGLSPFIDAGATLRHLGSFDGRGAEIDFSLQPEAASFHFETGRDLDVAETAGAGVRLRAGALNVSPEIRFMHWTSKDYQPVQNRLMLLLGITFPARR